MATKKRRKATSGAAPSAWEQFAAVSRAALSSAGAPKAKSARNRKRSRAVAGTQGPAQATALALRLGRKQAEWVVARHKASQERRAKVVAAAAKAPVRPRDKVRGAPAAKKKAARKLAPASGGAPSGSRGVLVAEGDSWFDYPFYDVLQ